MKIETDPGDWELARATYAEFSRKPGAEYIASEFALAHLSALLNRVQPRTVLELGAGIGTITHFLLTHPVAIEQLVSTELNDYCLEQLDINVPSEMRSVMELKGTPAEIEAGKFRFDLIILDGSFDPAVMIGHLSEGTAFFVEGARKVQLQALNEVSGQVGFQCSWTDYANGVKPLHISVAKHRGTGLPYPKLQIGKTVKGCTVGSISAD